MKFAVSALLGVVAVANAAAPEEQEFVQSKEVQEALKTEDEFAEMDDKVFAKITQWPKTFEDQFVLAKQDGTCAWKNTKTPSTREWSGWLKVSSGVCRVMKMPAKPWPSWMRCWRQIRPWIKKNP